MQKKSSQAKYDPIFTFVFPVMGNHPRSSETFDYKILAEVFIFAKQTTNCGKDVILHMSMADI